VLLPQSAGPQLVYRDRRFWDGEKKGKDGLAFVVSHPSQKKGRMGHPGLWLGWEDKDFGWVIRHEGKLRVSGRYRAGFQPFVVSFGPETQSVGLGWYSVAPLALWDHCDLSSTQVTCRARMLLASRTCDCLALPGVHKDWRVAEQFWKWGIVSSKCSAGLRPSLFFNDLRYDSSCARLQSKASSAWRRDFRSLWSHPVAVS
jgi:hypothetical protein